MKPPNTPIQEIRDVAAALVAASDERTRAEAQREQLLRSTEEARAIAEAAERKASFLAEVSAILGSSLDYDTTLARVARLAIPMLADLCAIDLGARTSKQLELHRCSEEYGTARVVDEDGR